MMANSEDISLNKNTNFDDNIDDDEDSNPWEELLSEAHQASSKLQEHRNILILGDLSCGKTSLIAKLQGNEEPKKGDGLEFSHVPIQDEYREDSTKLGVWYLAGDPTHTGLLKYALTAENFENTIVLVCASMSHPWSILKSIQDWLTILSDHVDRIGVSREAVNKCEQKLITQWKEYTEPDAQSSLLTSSTGEGEDLQAIPLGENTLTTNLGIPIVVVVTKTDSIGSLEKDHDYTEEKFDFIQLHIRKLCLSYGASLVYLSVKDEKNCELLLKYLAHRFYGLEFKSPASIIDKDSIFIPSGWDSDKKISILADNLTSVKADEDFDAVIRKPAGLRRAANRDGGDVSAEDEQEFLTRCNALLAKGAPAPVAAGSVESSSPMARTSSRSRLSTSPNTSAGTSPAKRDPKMAGQPEGQTVLANFFNNLLNKKAASPGKQAPESKEAVRAELDRMSRQKNSTS